MAAGDLVTRRIKFSYDKNSDDSAVVITKAATTFLAANYESITIKIVDNDTTKEGVTNATIILSGIDKA